MGKEYSELLPRHREFITAQRMFFTASAASQTRVNISPRSTDWFRVIADDAVAYLDRTGSGNETAAHAKASGAMTIMFCALDGPPQILRLYGSGRVVKRGGEEYAALLEAHFQGAEPAGARQIMRLDIDLVKTSCGYGVPLYDYRGERQQLDKWTRSKGVEGIEDYRREKNLRSMDGLPTGLLD
jgi:hypothetical protein